MSRPAWASWLAAARGRTSSVWTAWAERLTKRRRKRRRRQSGTRWSIGLECSRDPLDWHPRRATPLPLDATGGLPAADPFWLEHEGVRCLFFEQIDSAAPRASIAAAQYDPRTDRWQPLGVVLREPFHLSYPHVFTHRGQAFMIPESKQAGAVRLYRAVAFPRRWEYAAELIPNRKLVDPTPVREGDTWYLFASRHRRLYLYWAPDPAGPWRVHPRSPVRCGNHARCAGRILRHAGSLYRFAQEQRDYGAGVHVYRIETLTPSHYRERRCFARPLLQAGDAAWAVTGMHHIDILPQSDGTFLAAYDGEAPPP